MGKNEGLEGLRKRLEKLKWPAIYPFKFIAPIDKVDEVLALFEKADSETKISRNGNYVSVTVKPMMYNSDKVIEKYEEALKIEGLMAL